MSEPLPDDLAAALAAARGRCGAFGARVDYFAETGSTNDVALALADGGAPEGAVVVASAQTKGRGRLGRAWFSPPGAGLYVSIVIRRREIAPLLTLAGGVAVAEGIRAATGLPVELKWPNDVIMPAPGWGSRRKLAGILAEGSSSRDRLQYVVLGYGINVRDAAYPLELSARATSLEGELGRPVEAAVVFAETLAAVSARCDDLAQGRGVAVLQRWRELAPSAYGARVECDTAAGRAAGVSLGIADDGALLVRIGDRVERVVSGEVAWA